ncbi:hypothetical protein MLD38_003188 [Melastoma candidum]|uniref:Uncharacterized protein n=1 Tax=Melastoma candidum TaxID=119954 RepID=A0ACB9S5N0_9MYRT|nr:hypothetical protein MLD38_003188 [Melastoma candidum]
MSSFRTLGLASQALLVLSMFVRASVAIMSGTCTCSLNPTTTIVLYIQAILFTGSNSNYTEYPVAGIQGTEYSITQFATFYVFDDPVTISSSPTSTMVGRYRGIFAVASLDGKVLYLSATIQFTGGQYANSTINIEGLASTVVNMPMQLSIDGGTNAFNNAIGNVTLETISSIGPNIVLKATINTRNAI